MSAPIHLPVVRDNHVRPDLCGPCGGECCKKMPGAALPEDFGAPNEDVMAERIASALASGRWAIDWWESDPRRSMPRGERVSQAHYLRPSVRGNEMRVFHPSWGDDGGCTFLGSDGCTIFPSRPSGCRGLMPKADGQCLPEYGDKQEAAVAWLPFDAMLVRLGRAEQERRKVAA